MVDLNQLEALRAAATPGDFYLQYEINVMAADESSACNLQSNLVDAYARNTGNAAYLVAAANALPSLIARIRELERIEAGVIGAPKVTIGCCCGHMTIDNCDYTMEGKQVYLVPVNTDAADPPAVIELALMETYKETQYPGYARVVVPHDDAHWEPGEQGCIQNKQEIVFPSSQAGYISEKILYVSGVVKGKPQIIKLNKPLGIGPVSTTPVFKPGCLNIAFHEEEDED